MAIDKVVASLDAAVAGVESGSTILASGFGEAGAPNVILEHLASSGLRDLTIVSNNAGFGTHGLAALIEAGSVRKMICSYPSTAGSTVFPRMHAAGEIELELVPQGTLSERIRAGGAGIGGFFTRTGAGTLLSEGREHRTIDGEQFVFESPIRGDVALVGAASADRWGNLTYSKTARNYGPTMCASADLTIVQVRKIVALGDLDPEQVVTPGVYVDRVYLSEQ